MFPLRYKQPAIHHIRICKRIMTGRERIELLLSDSSIEELARIIDGESSQTIAVILTYIEKVKRAKLFQSLPKQQQIDVTKKMLTVTMLPAVLIDGIETGLLRKVEHIRTLFGE